MLSPRQVCMHTSLNAHLVGVCRGSFSPYITRRGLLGNIISKRLISAQVRRFTKRRNGIVRVATRPRAFPERRKHQKYNKIWAFRLCSGREHNPSSIVQPLRPSRRNLTHEVSFVMRSTHWTPFRASSASRRCPVTGVEKAVISPLKIYQHTPLISRNIYGIMSRDMTTKGLFPER